MKRGGFHHAKEDVGGSREPNCSAYVEGALEQPGKPPNNRRQNPPMEEERGEHAHDQHHRERLQREHELRSGSLQFKRQLASAEVTEHKGGARPRCGRDGIYRLIDRAKDAGRARKLEHDHGGCKGCEKPDTSLSPRDGTAVLAHGPGDCKKREDAQQRL